VYLVVDKTKPEE